MWLNHKCFMDFKHKEEVYSNGDKVGLKKAKPKF